MSKIDKDVVASQAREKYIPFIDTIPDDDDN